MHVVTERLLRRTMVYENKDTPVSEVTNRLETTSLTSGTSWLDVSDKKQKPLYGVIEVDVSVTVVWSCSGWAASSKISSFAEEECTCDWICWGSPTG